MRKRNHTHTHKLTPQPASKRRQTLTPRNKYAKYFVLDFTGKYRGQMYNGIYFSSLGVYLYIYDLRHYSNKTSYGFIYLFFLLSTYIITIYVWVRAGSMLCCRSVASVIIMARAGNLWQIRIYIYLDVCVWLYRFIENVWPDHLEASGVSDQFSLFEVTRFLHLSQMCVVFYLIHLYIYQSISYSEIWKKKFIETTILIRN